MANFKSVGLIAAVVVAAAGISAADDDAPSKLRVLTWNIWNGGDEAKNETDPAIKAAKQRRVADVIAASRADVVAMVETYGSGKAISRRLGYHFHPRGTNVSIHSRWPVKADLSVYDPFNCVGALIELPNGKQLAVYAVWVHYVDDIWTGPHSRDGRTAADLVSSDGDSRVTEVGAILQGIHDRTAELSEIPVILAGDFNSNSHLDYTEAARDQFGMVVPWPVTAAVARAGFRDAYRECHPNVDRMKDRTWSPRFPEQIQDRIDFIYWKGTALTPCSSTTLDRYGPYWPSDHAAVLATFAWK